MSLVLLGVVEEVALSLGICVAEVVVEVVDTVWDGNEDEEEDAAKRERSDEDIDGWSEATALT